jgi:L-aspartate oxidase
MESDFCVVGSGIAGLCFALHASSYGTVTMITKKEDSDSNTNHAQGGIACVLNEEDSFDKHIHDTLSTGQGLCNEEAVRILVEEGPARLKELIEWGASFSKQSGAPNRFGLHLGKEGGHSVNRIVHARDLTGQEIEQRLLAQARKNSTIRILENHYAIDFITNHHVLPASKENRCYGIYAFDRIKKQFVVIQARITMLVTGGAGRVYQHTTNPEIATGDGIAMAYRSGATIANMEFIQFHPTTLFHPDADSFLISEALRGFGAVLKNARGEEFMNRYHPLGSLAPRDIVARAIDSEIKKRGAPCVYLDIRDANASETKKHFPHIYSRCKEYGIDITKDLIPVVPAAHYMCGGVLVDTAGRTSIPNLYACGEVACTGVHGANRLASNSLLEALVFSRRAALHAGARLDSIRLLSKRKIPPWDDSGTVATDEWVLLSHNRTEIQSTMWDYVGIVRSTVRLQRARRRIVLLEKEIEHFYRKTKVTPELLELRNTATTAKLIILSALKRHESRGLHYTTDFPEKNDRFWSKNTILNAAAKNRNR